MVGKATMRVILEMARKLVDKEEYEQIKEKYTDESAKTTDRIHVVAAGEAIRLVDAVLFQDSTNEEIIKAVYYCRVCMDAEKKHLDYIRYRKENGIEELADKYGVKLTKWKKRAA